MGGAGPHRRKEVMRKLKLQMKLAGSTAYPCGIVVNSYLPK